MVYEKPDVPRDEDWASKNKFRLLGKATRISLKFLSRKNKDGGTQETALLNFAVIAPVGLQKTQMFFCEAWSELAEEHAKLQEGTIIRCDGHVRNTTWKKEGQQVWATRFTAANIDIIDTSSAVEKKEAPKEEVKPESEADETPNEEDEVPF